MSSDYTFLHLLVRRLMPGYVRQHTHINLVRDLVSGVWSLKSAWCCAYCIVVACVCLLTAYSHECTLRDASWVSLQVEYKQRKKKHWTFGNVNLSDELSPALVTAISQLLCARLSWLCWLRQTVTTDTILVLNKAFPLQCLLNTNNFRS